MINRNSVHLPDTTYGGNPIDWNCSSDSDDSLQRLKAENAKLRKLVRDMWHELDAATWNRGGRMSEEAMGWSLSSSEQMEYLRKDIRKLKDENAKLRELCALMYRDMQGVLDMSTDTVWVDDIGTLRDEMDCHMQSMAELGMPPADYERRMRELGIEVD